MTWILKINVEWYIWRLDYHLPTTLLKAWICHKTIHPRSLEITLLLTNFMLCWDKSALIRVLSNNSANTKNIYMACGGEYEFKFGEGHFVDLHWVQKNFSLQAYVLCRLLLDVSTSKFSAERFADTPKRLLSSSAKYQIQIIIKSLFSLNANIYLILRHQDMTVKYNFLFH